MFVWYDKAMHSFLRYLWSRLTFKRFVILVILFLFSLIVIKSVFGFGNNGEESSMTDYEYKFAKGDESSSNKILAIPVQGLIMTEETSVPNPLDALQNQGVSYGYDIKDSLERAANDPDIKGILLQIDSPGGTIPGSKAIADGVTFYRQHTGHPVIAHIRDEGASGAYWAAVAADKVIADTGSITGSIGVLMGPFTYYDKVVSEGSILDNVSTQNGIDTTYITAGKYKDTGSPYRKMTQEEIDHWQTSVNNEYDLFVDHVSQTRHIPKDVIVNQIKALPYENKRALQYHLIDETGTEEQAVAEILAKDQISPDDFQLIYESQKGGLIQSLLSAAMKINTPKIESVCALCNTPLYLYDSTYSLFKN